MPVIGKFKTVAVLLLLCFLASIFYIRVWSSISSEGDEVQLNHIFKGSEKEIGREGEGGRKESGEDKKVLFRHHHHIQQKQKLPQSAYDKPNIQDDIAGQQQDNGQVPPIPILSLKQIEKQRLKDFKAQEKAEKQRQKEEKRLRKAAKLAKLEMIEKVDTEPFPALISTNNARLAALNSKAFLKFCHKGSSKDPAFTDPNDNLLSDLLSWTDFSGFKAPSAGFGAETEWGVGNSGSITAEDSQARRFVLVDRDFETFEEWMDYVNNKNSGQEQESEPEPSTIMESIRQRIEQQQQPEQSEQNQAQSQLEGQETEVEDQYSILKLLEQRKSKIRPLFWERPLRGWIVNHSAIQEPCDRTKHTSAHCLSFLQHDHLYLVPNHASRESPNKLPIVQATFNRFKNDEDIELDTYYGNPSVVPPSAPNTMHFHIFWRGVISDKLSLAAHAFLFTQPLERSILHLWIDSTDLPNGKPEVYEDNPFAKDLVSGPLKNYVRLHKWDQKSQQIHAYGLSDEMELLSKMPIKDNVPPVALSDQARFMILHRYGGMYLDADVLLLRDMSPLYDSGMEFAYEWSNTQMYNTAILMLNRRSNVARRILDGAKAKEKELQEEQAAREKQQQEEENGEVEEVEEEEEQLTPEGEEASEEETEESGDEGESEEGDEDEQDEQDEEAEGADRSEDSLRRQKLMLKLENGAKRRTRGKPKQQLSVPAVVSAVEVDKGAVQHDPTSQTPSPPSPLSPPVKPLPADEDYLGPDAEDESIFDYPISSLYASPHSRRFHKRGEMRPKEVYHPARLRLYLSPGNSSIANNGLIMMPTAIFDPLWLRVDGVESKTGLVNDKRFKMMEDLNSFPEAFTNPDAVCPAQKDHQEGSSSTFIAGPEVFFTGAFAYHWHNNWVTPIKPQSWMGQMSKAYNDFLAGKRPNLYGEWFSGDI